MSRLSARGYVLRKDAVEPEDLDMVRKDLSLLPKEDHMVKTVHRNPIVVYRENDAKIYLPRFYGMETFGPPDVDELSPGDDIDVPFTQSLRDYQHEIVNTYFNHVQSGSGGGILEVPCGRGKCLGYNTPVLMYDGTIKRVQDIQKGEQIMGDDSTPRNVLTLARGREKMYKVQTNNGESYTVNESHILSLKYNIDINEHTKKNDVLDISVSDYLQLPAHYHDHNGPLHGYRVPIEFPATKVPINPYLLGYWLGGDEHSYSTNISTQDTNEFRSFLRDVNLSQNKHIPHCYKCNSREVRLQILAGLIDSCGSMHSNRFDIIQKNEVLIDDIVFVARSLGFAAFKTESESIPDMHYKTTIFGSGVEEIPVQCSLKHATFTKRTQDQDCLTYRIHLTPLGEDDYYGFEIDGNRRFVLGDFTVTHNTIMSLNICSVLKKKTLILVHKEFLMNQWIDRIRDFLPSARVGKIQGKVFDVDDKDIVIGMMQTMYKAEYSPHTFHTFGLTIIDEVHRVGSEEFSKTLLKVITPYMLGISATVDRKDGLTDLLYMFIGPKIYSETRKESDGVQVRALQYNHPHEEYTTEHFDMRGTIQYSTMVSQISDFLPRKQFIVRVLRDLMEEDSGKQIMVLSHKRDLLDYLEEEINQTKFASCGQYVGGMKQHLLDISETKEIVLATYAMAAEALDIKTLNTLVMVSPKTDIVQSVGRILRTRGDGKIIVDIVDSHNVFQNQWKKRRTFYNKSNYTIKMIGSTDYVNMHNVDSWPTLEVRAKKEKPTCMLAL